MLHSELMNESFREPAELWEFDSLSESTSSLSSSPCRADEVEELSSSDGDSEVQNDVERLELPSSSNSSEEDHDINFEPRKLAHDPLPPRICNQADSTDVEAISTDRNAEMQPIEEVDLIEEAQAVGHSKEDVAQTHWLPDATEIESLPDSPIGQRTRARNPLKEVTIEELEALLQEDEVMNSDYEDDQAYQQFLQALSGEGTKGEVSFPDEGEDDCDDDFLLDLDELAAAGEESFEPSALPKRTHFRRSPAGSPTHRVQWIPQELTNNDTPLTNNENRNSLSETMSLATCEAGPGKRAKERGEKVTVDSMQNGPSRRTGQEPLSKKATLAGAAAVKPRKRRKKATAICQSPMDLDTTIRPAPPHQTVRGQDPNRSSGFPSSTEGMQVELDLEELACQAAYALVMEGEYKKSENNALEMERQKSDGSRKKRKARLSKKKQRIEAEEEARTAQIREWLAEWRASGSCIPSQLGTLPTSIARLSQEAELHHQAIKTSSNGEPRLAEGACGQQQDLALSVAPPCDSALSLLADSCQNVHNCQQSAYERSSLHMESGAQGTASGPPEPRRRTGWTVEQLGQLRLQVGQHLQQLCHSVALAKCVNNNPQLLEQGRSLLVEMGAFCLRQMGQLELQQAPYLPDAVKGPLAVCCTVPPCDVRIRTAVAVPIVGQLHILLSACNQGSSSELSTSAMHAAGIEQQSRFNMQLALSLLAPYMDCDLFPKFQWKPYGWTSAEHVLLRHGLARFGTDVFAIQKFCLPPKSEGRIRAQLTIEREACLSHKPKPPPPLTESELDTIRKTLKELKGAARVWDVLSQDHLQHRTSEELRSLYHQQGYGAATSGVWRRNGQQSLVGKRKIPRNQ